MYAWNKRNKTDLEFTGLKTNFTLNQYILTENCKCIQNMIHALHYVKNDTIFVINFPDNVSISNRRWVFVFYLFFSVCFNHVQGYYVPWCSCESQRTTYRNLFFFSFYNVASRDQTLVFVQAWLQTPLSTTPSC